ncbi:MAG: leucyl-tRNA synthetase [uncultured archaeon A07HN63]|nr:MAG: leucyl-tRNA synthetase [uncultured archaeon A07HN63]
MSKTHISANTRAYWQQIWETNNLFTVDDDAADPTYILGMFPFTSGDLHMGHVRNYTIADAYARYRRLQGEEVLQPMGWDAFGLPTENESVANDVDPEFWTEQCIDQMRDSMEKLGFSYDWDRELRTSDPEYYRWTQWLFKRLYEHGLAERAQRRVKWCPEDETALADEQVDDGACWRCGTEVETRELDQWFFELTAYADELLDGLDDLQQWPESVKQRQRNWIGRREGVTVTFETDTGDEIDVFTKRLDRLYGTTYLALAPDHPMSRRLAESDPDIAEFVSTVDRTEGDEFDGMRTGVTAIHPATGAELPVYIGAYVVDDLGTGAVMGTPAHDENDHAFATAHDIEHRVVIEPEEDSTEIPYTGEGELIEGGEYTGVATAEAREQLLADLDAATQHTDYRVRDWCISRQRYWGTPIPVVHCEDCGEVLVPDEELPVELPDFTPETGTSLAAHDEFVETTCPECGRDARRETDTLDTFVDSAWYYLRFISPDEGDQPFDTERASEWLPIDQYVGGDENAVMHLLYLRFFARALADIGLIDTREPVRELLTHGMVLNDGTKMSKSEGNVISPAEYGVATTRLFILGAVTPESDFDWSNHRRTASYTLQKELQRLATEGLDDVQSGERRQVDEHVAERVDSAIRTTTDHYESLDFYDVVRELRSLYSTLSEYEEYTTPHENVFRRGIGALVRMLAPITPYLSEELWSRLGDGLLAEGDRWPEPRREGETDERGQRLVESTREDIRDIHDSVGGIDPDRIRIVVAPAWKYAALETALDAERNIYDTVMDEHGDRQGDEVADYARHLAENRYDLGEELPQAREQQVLERASWLIEKELDAEVTVEAASDAEPALAERARPGKPAISIE